MGSRSRCIRASHARDGADGDRTHDLRLAKPALSQLSYSPSESDRHGHRQYCWSMTARSTLLRWAQVESNYRPYPYQGYALAD